MKYVSKVTFVRRPITFKFAMSTHVEITNISVLKKITSIQFQYICLQVQTTSVRIGSTAFSISEY